MNSELIPILITGGAIAISASLLGRFIVLKKLSLVADVLSHIALPGIALGILIHINPFIGAFLFLTLATLGIWWIEIKTDLQIDSIIGIFFVTSLALGALLIPNDELIEALFGSIENIGTFDMTISIILALITVGALVKLRRGLILTTLSPEIASTSGINVPLNKLGLLLLLALIVAFGIKITGIVLIAALLIVPAASAQNLAHGFKWYSLWGVAFGITSMLGGLIFAFYLNTSPGPPIILFGTALFILSLFFRKH